MPGDDDAGNIRRKRAHLLEHLDAGHVRQINIGDEQVERFAARRGNRLRACRDIVHPITGVNQNGARLGAQFGMIFEE